jgi:hypothetical protein
MQHRFGIGLAAALAAVIILAPAKPNAQPVPPPAGATLALNMKWQRLGSVAIGARGRIPNGLIFRMSPRLPGSTSLSFACLEMCTATSGKLTICERVSANIALRGEGRRRTDVCTRGFDSPLATMATPTFMS